MNLLTCSDNRLLSVLWQSLPTSQHKLLRRIDELFSKLALGTLYFTCGIAGPAKTRCHRSDGGGFLPKRHSP
jgi:hypothetical protein